jgi:hypothetical protein
MPTTAAAIGGEIAWFTAAEIHRLGLEVIHDVPELPSDFRASGNRLKYDRFRQLYGVDPETCVKLIQDIRTIAPPDARIDKPEETKLLMTLEWLKTVKGMVDLRGLYKICPKTTLKYRRKYIKVIQSLKASKIMFRRPDGVVESRTVDCLHIPIREPRSNPSAKFCSPKMKRPALSYEVCLIARRQQVAWINGPFPAGVPDLNIYRVPGGLKDQLQDGEYLFADLGYRGEPQTLRIRNHFDTEAVKEAKRRSLARQESFNARLKSFKILTEPFKGKHKHAGITCHDEHKAVVEAIVVLLQYEMENGHLLFTV